MSEFSDINFKKRFGQNFLSDKNLLSSIALDADITGDDVVLEIGAGAGALTSELVKRAKKVISFEIDKELLSLLNDKFKNVNNLEIIFEDFLNFNEDILLEKIGTNFKVVANLPYYITTPILTKLFNLRVRPQVIVVMVQKEVGERIVAMPKSSSYGYFSVFVQANADAKITRIVNKRMFYPVPKVDSCIVKLTPKNNVYNINFFDFLKNCFAMKRKTLVNNLEKAYGIKKLTLEEKLKKLNISENARADGLAIDELNEIYKAIFN